MGPHRGISWRGQAWTIKDACAVAGVKVRTYEWRRGAGWSVDKALDTPVDLVKAGKVQAPRVPAELARVRSRRVANDRLRIKLAELVRSARRIERIANGLAERLGVTL